MKEKLLLFIDKFLLWSIRYVNKFHLYILNKDIDREVKYKFLTANDNAKNIKEYSLGLSEALEDHKVKNIAISGSYGSGKSSFIKTFEKNNSQYTFLDISLAKFNSDDTQESDLSLIEKSILEQMFYKVKNKTIPQSRLNKIDRLKLMPLKVVAILGFIASYLVLFQPQILDNLSFIKDFISNDYKSYIKYGSFIYMIIGAFFVVQKSLILLSNISINKLNLKDIELSSNSDNGSLLNKYLDEILYFFERTNIDIVVFQDLDRFGNLDIFTKLRELNNFINNSEQVDKKIVFIYAVKDEIFKDIHERTKFFDFLIPVIPYINSTNSIEMLLEYFKQDVDGKFLYDISLYISDMRLLKNIYNEYLIYSKNLNNVDSQIQLSSTKLLAMIIYKNFEPQDFEELHKCKGNVFALFDNRMDYVNSNIEVMDENIQKLKLEIQKIDNEPRDNVKELRQIYILKIIEKLKSQFNGNLYLDGKEFSIEQSLENDNFELIKESDRIISKYMNYNYNSDYDSNPINFSDIENEIGAYDDREELVLNKSNNKINKLLEEINELGQNKEELKYYKIKEIIENIGDTNIFTKDYFEDKKLLKYLISYGYIDEGYEDYISNFFGVSITKDEQEFLLNIKNNGNHLNFGHKLTNIDDILSNRLSTREFKKESILNYDLVGMITKNKAKYKEQYKVLFIQLSNNTPLSKKFILSYIKSNENDKYFLESILLEWGDFWEYLTQWDNFDATLRENILYQIISNCNEIIIINSSHNNNLKEAIAILSNWSALVSNVDALSKFKNIIKILDVKFELINPTQIDKKLLDYLYSNNYYQLNVSAISHLLQAKDKTKEFNSTTAQLSMIKKFELKKLLVYIDLNINIYINESFLKSNVNTQESEEDIIGLLNNNNLDKSLKEKIIISQKNKIQDITNIKENSLWANLLKENLLTPSWNNIFEYYNLDGNLSSFLFDYLNIEENAKQISKTRVDSKYFKEHKNFNTKILKDIIYSNDFRIKSYEYLIENLGYWYDTLEIRDLDQDKISLLIKHNRFQFKKVCFDALKEYTDNGHIRLLEKNKDGLLEKFEDFEFNTDDIINILESSNISGSIKKDFIEKVNLDLISNKIIAKLIYLYMDKKHIKDFDYSKKILEHLEDIESKINLIMQQKSIFNNQKLIEALHLLPAEYQKIANLDGKQTTLDNTNYNQDFIKLLKENNLVTTSKSEKNKIRLYIKKQRTYKV